ncbi:uncharacterized protein LOC126792229 [Argentina anserina]|uniref:uncharacterized protein LOC126792229 n=1 Tax=Argentina anserina TaxID=57926 RepID=UPI002176530F|nr:uncharacterized protein LOC126792229 [Potentilla anserina]
MPSYIPKFECLLGKQIVKLELPVGTSLYGTGEVSGQLERTGKRVFTWNMDAWGYGSGTTSLYQSHPWVLAVLPSGEALGVLADTTKRCEIDLRRESMIHFIAPSSYPIITFGPFASPSAVLIALSHAIVLVLNSVHYDFNNPQFGNSQAPKYSKERRRNPRRQERNLNKPMRSSSG